jgi:acetylornithine deacetylase/succinyl-diaminopimelate desuccinylase-like protein
MVHRRRAQPDAADPPTQGSFALHVTARGLPGHSSPPGRGVSAVHAIAEAITYIAAA